MEIFILFNVTVVLKFILRMVIKDNYHVNYNKETFEAKDPLPTCKRCKDYILRPNIMMFNDYFFNSDRIDE